MRNAGRISEACDPHGKVQQDRANKKVYERKSRTASQVVAASFVMLVKSGRLSRCFTLAVTAVHCRLLAVSVPLWTVLKGFKDKTELSIHASTMQTYQGVVTMRFAWFAQGRLRRPKPDHFSTCLFLTLNFTRNDRQMFLAIN